MFFIDSNNRDEVDWSTSLLINEDALKDCPVVVLSTKQDISSMYS